MFLTCTCVRARVHAHSYEAFVTDGGGGGSSYADRRDERNRIKIKPPSLPVTDVQVAFLLFWKRHALIRYNLSGQCGVRISNWR